MRRASVLLLLVLLAAACGNGATAARNPRTTLQLRDAFTGQVRWAVDLRPEADATEPVLAGDVVIVADPAADAVAFSVANGREVWRVPGALPEGVSPSLVVFDYEDRIEGRRPSDGRLVWRRSGHEDLVRSRQGRQLVVVDDGRLAAHQGPAVVSLIDPRDGKARWRTSLTTGTSAFNGGVTAHHVFLELPDHGGVQALSLADGLIAWRHLTDYLAGLTTTDDLVALRIATEDATQEVREASAGRLLWSTPDEVLLSDQRPFVGASAGAAFLRDPRSGRRLEGRVPFAYGVVWHKELLVGAGPRTLTAVRAGVLQWTSPLRPGRRPITYLDADDRYVASVTATGQAITRD